MTEEEQAELQAEHQAQDDALIDKAIGELLNSEHGRRFLWSALGLGGLFSNSFTVGDQYATAFHLGEQNVAQQVLSRVASLYPEGWFNLQKEMNGVRHRRDNQLRGND